MALEVRILGPLEVAVDGELRRLRGGKQRSLLALLALAPGEVVSAERVCGAGSDVEHRAVHVAQPPPSDPRQARTAVVETMMSDRGTRILPGRLRRAGSATAPAASNDSTCVESVVGDATVTQPSGMHLIRIDHVSLNVHDRPLSIAWYEEVLGMRAHSGDAPAAEPVFLGPRGRRLGRFADRAPGRRPGALATDGVGQQRLVDRLDRLGIRYQPERHRDSHSIYFADPDGTMLEVMVATT
jgi:catechol 2,3-dioxygenase-like lactoylglutathione lyase family enzyme